MQRWTTLLLVALATGGVLAVGQQPAPAQAPQFRAVVELTHLDVTVLDRNRRPVRGLTAADFVIEEDGTPQKIEAFSFVDLPPRQPATALWMRNVAPDVTTNDLAERRLVVIVVDDATVGSLAAVKSAKETLHKIVDELGPSDLASVVFSLNNRRAQDFTADREKLMAAVDSLTVGFPEGDIPVCGCGGCGQDVVRRVAESLLVMPLRRKVIFFVSRGVDAAVPPPGSVSACGSSAFDTMVDTIRTAQRANVAVYPIDPGGLLVDAPLNSAAGRRIDYLLTVAENTGGRAVINTNAPEDRVQDLFRENTSYYLLGYRTVHTGNTGRFHRLSVKSNRPGLDVRTRNGFYEPRADAKSKVPVEGSDLLEAISGVLPKSDLPLRATAAAFATPGTPGGAVAVVLGVGVIGTEVRTKESIDLKTSVFTPDGRPKGTFNQHGDIVLRASTARTQSVVDALMQIELPPGRYSLRLAATSALRGTQGSVYLDVTVPDVKKQQVTLSDFVLGVTPPVPSGPPGALNSLLPFVPTTLRDFTTADSVKAFGRVYVSGSPLTRFTVVTQVFDRMDRVAWAQRMAMSGAQLDANRSVPVGLDLPLKSLAPGPYALVIEASLLGGTPVKKTVRFSLR